MTAPPGTLPETIPETIRKELETIQIGPRRTTQAASRIRRRMPLPDSALTQNSSAASLGV
jgi:hypothetical protein